MNKILWLFLLIPIIGCSAEHIHEPECSLFQYDGQPYECIDCSIEGTGSNKIQHIQCLNTSPGGILIEKNSTFCEFMDGKCNYVD